MKIKATNVDLNKTRTEINMNPEPGYQDNKSAYTREKKAARDKQLASSKKAKETFKKLKAKRKKK